VDSLQQLDVPSPCPPASPATDLLDVNASQIIRYQDSNVAADVIKAVLVGAAGRGRVGHGGGGLAGRLRLGPLRRPGLHKEANPYSLLLELALS